MWVGVSPVSPGADVDGVSPVPAQMWVGVSPVSPGADVDGVSSVPALAAAAHFFDSPTFAAASP